MNEQNKKIQLLGSVPIPKALLSLGLPTMVGMLINALYNLVDTYFVGGLGTNQMGAITVAFPLGQVIVGLGLLFGNGAAAYLSRLLAKRDKETAMYALLCGAALNVILDPIMIYLMNLGVIGAAIATAISQIVSFLVYLTYILKKKSMFSFNLNQYCPGNDIMSEILKVGIPTMLFQILTSTSIAMINNAAKEYGTSFTSNHNI